MRTQSLPFVPRIAIQGLTSALFVIALLVPASAQNRPENAAAMSDDAMETVWHIKAFHPDGYLLDVKALDSNGKIYAVKAIQDAEQTQFLDIKAMMGDDRLPVKVLVSNDRYAPVKAIGTDGTIYDIKALTEDGARLDVKGVAQAGNLLHIKAIGPDGTFYGVKAISPEGAVNDVKGIKVSKDPVEANVNGVQVYAHVKAIPQR